MEVKVAENGNTHHVLIPATLICLLFFIKIHVYLSKKVTKMLKNPFKILGPSLSVSAPKVNVIYLG